MKQVKGKSQLHTTKISPTNFNYFNNHDFKKNERACNKYTFIFFFFSFFVLSGIPYLINAPLARQTNGGHCHNNIGRSDLGGEINKNS